MTFNIEHGTLPDATIYDQGVEDGRRIQARHALDDIARFKAQVEHKKDPYTRGFIAGLSEKVA